MSINSFDQYQQRCSSTAIYPDRGSLRGLVYCTLKLNGEAGEVAEKVGKAIRDDAGQISDERRAALILELGDVLWYVAMCADELGVELSHVIAQNRLKLRNRKAKGTLKGDGDNR